LFIVLAAPAHASPIALGASVSPQTANIASRLEYTFYAEWPDGWNVKPPRLKPEQDSFEVVSCRDPVLDQLPDGRHRMRVACDLILFDSGRVDLPTWPVSIAGPNGLSYDDASPALQVEAVAPLVGDQPRPIKPPEKVNYNWPRTLLIAGAALAAIAALSALAYLIVRLVKGRKNAGPKAKPAPDEPADVRALRRLADPLLDNHLFKQDANSYYTELTEIVREYLERRFTVPALEQTSAEILGAVERVDLKGHQPYLRALLMVADLAKFAEVPPPQSQWLPDRENARRLVVDTRPTAPDAPPAEGTAA